MSDVMFYGVLRMPYEIAMADEMSRFQFYNRVQEAVDRVEKAEAKLAAIEASRPATYSHTTRQDMKTKSKIGSRKALLENIRLQVIKQRLKAAFKRAKPATPQGNLT